MFRVIRNLICGFVFALTLLGAGSDGFVNAQEVNTNKFILGGGLKSSMYSTGETDYYANLVTGASVPINDSGTWSFLTPDEVYLTGTYSRYQADGQDSFTGVYEVGLRGLTYFNKNSASLFHPFVVTGLLYQNENTPGPGAIGSGSGEFGLGTGYSLDPNYGVWGACTAVIGADIVVRAAFGLYFNL